MDRYFWLLQKNVLILLYFVVQKFYISFFGQYIMHESIIGPRHAKPRLRAYADSEGPDQTARSRSLIRPFTAR